MAEGTAEDIAGLPSGLKIQLRKLFPNLSTVTVAAPAPVVIAKPNSLLEDGVDPRTGIDWSAMPDDVIAMIRFAAKDNMVRGMSDKAIATAFGGEDPDLLRDLRKVPITSAKPLGDDALRQMIVNASAKLVQSYDKASIRFMLGDYPDLSPRAVSNMSDRCAEIARSMNFIVQVDNYRDGGSSVLTLRRNV